MPTPVVPGESVQLVDDDRAHVAEQQLVVDFAEDEHRLEGLRRRQQDVRRVGDHAAAGLRGPTSPCQSPTRRPTNPA